MIAALRQFYGLQPTPPADLFQFLVWEILSENALPARRDLAWQALRRISALTPDAMFRAPAKALLHAVGISGPNPEDKVERIRATVGEFKRHRQELDAAILRRGSTLRAGRALKRLTHVPPAMRARAHLFVLDSPVLPIDDDITRVASRLMGLPQNRTRAVSRRWLSRELPREPGALRDAVVYLRHHARHTCVKVAPHCGVCPLRVQCPSASSATPPGA